MTHENRRRHNPDGNRSKLFGLGRRSIFSWWVIFLPMHQIPI